MLTLVTNVTLFLRCQHQREKMSGTWYKLFRCFAVVLGAMILVLKR